MNYDLPEGSKHTFTKLKERRVLVDVKLQSRLSLNTAKKKEVKEYEIPEYELCSWLSVPVKLKERLQYN